MCLEKFHHNGKRNDALDPVVSSNTAFIFIPKILLLILISILIFLPNIQKQFLALGGYVWVCHCIKKLY
jgi:hypothetical protein